MRGDFPALAPLPPEITHPDKVLFPADGITKGELAAYYANIAPLLLPHVAGRPVTMERFPAGIGRKGFIQKNAPKGAPEWLEQVEVPKKDGSVRYPIVRDVRSLVWLANQNCITPHVWTSRLPALDHPDLCVIDLDPPDEDPEPVRVAALAVREVLSELGLASWLKTSGSKGFHVVVPLAAEETFESAWRFTHGVGVLLVKRHPETLTQEFLKVDRGGRILVDTGRNGPGATFAAAYAVRPKPLAPVSAPCTWEELEREGIGPRSFTLRGMEARIAAAGDPWANLHDHGQHLAPALAALSSLVTEEEWNRALAARTRKPGRSRGRERP
jgi:bifunctional non-homologous end joining protein LigD